VFDQQGEAVHMIYVAEGTDRAAFEALLAAHADSAQPVTPEPRPAPERKADQDVDVDAFRQEWRELRDTHEFFGLLRRHGVERTQALRLAPPEFARQVGVGAVDAVLDSAAGSGLPIMVFVGNAGCVQIHTGPVHRIAPMGPWLNVLDPGFNLHLREDHIASAWLVRKPTVDGLVCSLELFDAQGRTIAMMFGERKPGQAERCDWRNLLESLVEGAPEAVPC
jgi:putative hemin transport protein